MSVKKYGVNQRLIDLVGELNRHCLPVRATDTNPEDLALLSSGESSYDQSKEWDRSAETRINEGTMLAGDFFNEYHSPQFRNVPRGNVGFFRYKGKSDPEPIEDEI